MGWYCMKRYDQYSRHLAVLSRAGEEDLNNEFIISGIIDKFNIQFELGWKVMKEILKYEGRNQAYTGSPREIIKEAYACFDFIEEEVWLSMLRDRNDNTHIYNENAAKILVDKILNDYIRVFGDLEAGVLKKYGSILNEL